MQHFFNCHNHCCHWLFTITCRTVSDYFWLLWTCWNWLPHGWSFILGVKNKSQETKLRWVRRVGYHSYFYLPKLQHCPPVHCLSESTISGSAIILNVFSLLAATDVANFLVVMLFSLEQQIPNEQCPHNGKQSPTCSWCLTWFAILPWDEERRGFATERTYVWFLGWNVGHRLCLLLWPSRGSCGHFFLHFFICMNYQGMNFTHTEVPLHLNQANNSSPYLCHRKLFYAHHAFLMQFPSLKQRKVKLSLFMVWKHVGGGGEL